MEKYDVEPAPAVPLLRGLITLIFLSGLMLCFSKTAQAQTVLGARQLAMGQALTASGDNSWAIFGNPALLAGSTASVSFYGMRNYGFAELTDAALSGALPLLGGTAGAGMHTFGDELYRETHVRAGFGFARSGLAAGIVLNYTHLAIQGYGSGGSPTIDAGLAWQVLPELHLGARALNLNRGRVGEAREELPRELAVGLAYALAERARFAADAVKDVRFPLAFRAGLEIFLLEAFALRGGLTTAPQTFSAGAGYRFSQLSVNVVAQQHFALGWSPGLDITLHF